MITSDPISNHEKARRYITRVKDLPTLPAVVTNILLIVNQDTSSADQLGKAVAMDQSLAANVLKLSNSAFYGFSRRISTITDAIIHLGFNVVRCLAVSASVIDLFKKGENKEFFNYQDFWRHSIGCGVISRMIALQRKIREPEAVLLAGILHDIGKLVLDRYMAVDFNQILTIANTQEMDFYRAEQAYSDVDHAQIGSWLADWWKIPAEIVEPIHYHHKDNYEGENPFVTIIALANAICHDRDIGNSGYRKTIPLDRTFWESRGFDETIIDFIYSNIDEELAKAKIFETLTT